jgi:large subunit ribosomal protein L24
VRIRANDNVMVIRGRDRGKQGRVTRTVTADQKVVVEGVNVVKKHAKRTGNVRQAGIIQKEMPIPTSSVVLVCPHCLKPSKLGRRILADGTKARVCKRCEQVIE